MRESVKTARAPSFHADALVSSLLDGCRIQRNGDTRVREQIERFLETHIRNGDLPVGCRLPPTLELATLWRVNLVSVQEAMASLKRKGLIERKARSGTRVRSATSQLRVGLLVGPDLADPSATYYRALTGRIQAMTEGRGWDDCVVDAATQQLGAKGGPSASQVEALCQRIRAQACRGLLFIGILPQRIEPVLEALRLPVVRCNENLHFTDVANDLYRCGWDLVAYLQKRGCPRFTCIGCLEGSSLIQGIRHAVLEHGGPEPVIHPVVIRRGYSPQQSATDTLAQLMPQWEQSGERPDALVVADDIAMLAASGCLRDMAEARRPLLVTLANEDVLHDYGLPVVRYVYPVKRKAEIALEILAQRMRGEEPRRLPVLLSGEFVEPPVQA